jgi:hypothetical protein
MLVVSADRTKQFIFNAEKEKLDPTPMHDRRKMSVYLQWVLIDPNCDVSTPAKLMAAIRTAEENGDVHNYECNPFVGPFWDPTPKTSLVPNQPVGPLTAAIATGTCPIFAADALKAAKILKKHQFYRTDHARKYSPLRIRPWENAKIDMSQFNIADPFQRGFFVYAPNNDAPPTRFPILNDRLKTFWESVVQMPSHVSEYDQFNIFLTSFTTAYPHPRQWWYNTHSALAMRCGPPGTHSGKHSQSEIVSNDEGSNDEESTNEESTEEESDDEDSNGQLEDMDLDYDSRFRVRVRVRVRVRDYDNRLNRGGH